MDDNRPKAKVTESVTPRKMPTPGRRKGIPNKATQAAREAIALFVDNNAGRLQEWLDQIAIDNPIKAFEMFQSVIEYHVPKLARTEHVGDGGGPVRIFATTHDEAL